MGFKTLVTEHFSKLSLLFVTCVMIQTNIDFTVMGATIEIGTMDVNPETTDSPSLTDLSTSTDNVDTSGSTPQLANHWNSSVSVTPAVPNAGEFVETEGTTAWNTIRNTVEAINKPYLDSNLTDHFNGEGIYDSDWAMNETDTSPETTPLPPLADMSCELIEQYGGWNFYFKYDRDEVNDALCRCSGYCEMATIPTELKSDVQTYLTDPFSRANMVQFVAIVTLYAVICIVGVTGNILTLVGLSTWMKQKSPTYGFIMSLSCSDLLLLCVCLPLKLVEYFHFGDVFNSWTCKGSYYLRDFIMTCSVLTLTLISFERYYAICKPFVVQYLCTWSRARKLIVCTWIISLGLAVPTIYVMELYTVGHNTYQECLPQATNSLYLILYFTYFTGVLFALPGTIMSCTYGRSCHVLWRSTVVAKRLKGIEHKQDTENNKDNPQKETEDIQARKKVVRGLVCIVTLYLMCWGPSLSVQLLTGMNIFQRFRKHYRLGFETLTYISSAVNPYLFMTMSSQFCSPLGCCLRRRQPATPTQESKTRATEFTGSSANGLDSPSKY